MKNILDKCIRRCYGIYLNSWVLFSKQNSSKKAYTLFCTPRKGKIRANQKAFLEKAKDAQLECHNQLIQTYKWHGSGATVLLLHGWESNSFRWQSLVNKLQESQYNIVAMDAPAHGNSSGKIFNVPLYADCAQKIIEKYKPVYIIGHSIGGMTMLYHQYKYPNTSIEKLVALAAPSELSEFTKQYKNMLGLSTKLMQHLEQYFIKKFGFNFEWFSTKKFVLSCSQKGLLVHDEFDTITPFWCSAQVHHQWKNSSIIKTNGLGHSLYSDKVNTKIIRFLKS